jgi:hydroxymethylbilane synthase
MTSPLPSPAHPLKIGTRGSPLALAQAHETRDRLMAAHGLPEAAFAITVIKVTGDQILDRPLKDIGGKGLFTREIEEALLAGEIDIAVHSSKDMPTVQPEGLVGTSSLRRRAQLMARRPDLRVVEFRGNVQTRLRKLEEGVAEATFLAMAGLNRLGLVHLARSAVDPEDMLPAVAQGAIGIERRVGDGATEALLAPIACAATGARLACERAFLARLDGSCQTPIAGLARIEGGAMWLKGEVLRPDGSEVVAAEARAPLAEAVALGDAVGRDILGRLPAGFFG